MWLMILIAVHTTNPQDQPGRIELVFPNQISCEQALATMRYDLKFKTFKVTGQCQKQS
jgi:hypothetical protein